VSVWGFDITATPTPETSIGLWWYYLDAGDMSDTHWDGASLHWVQLTGTVRTGRLTFTGDFIFDFGDYDQGLCSPVNADGQYASGCVPGTEGTGVEGDIGGFATDLRATYDADWATMGLIFSYSTGDDNLEDNDRDAFTGIAPWMFPTNVMGVGRWDWNLVGTGGIGGEGPSFGTAWNVPARFNGITYVQLNATKAFTPKFTADTNVTFMWSSESSEQSPTHQLGGLENSDKSLGWELDVNATYKIYDQLTWFFESGVFFPSDYYQYIDGDVDDPNEAWNLASGIEYVF